MMDDQKQIVLGTLLGNGFICNSSSPYLCIQHSSRYLSYMRSKVSHIEEFGRNNAWYFKDNTCGWRSKCSPIWNSFKDMCYEDGEKIVTMGWLDRLRAIGIAVWYADSGCLMGNKKNNACLRTQSFNEAGNAIICQYFNEVGLECNLNKSKNSQVVVFTAAGSKILFTMVAPYIHPTMYAKLLKE